MGRTPQSRLTGRSDPRPAHGVALECVSPPVSVSCSQRTLVAIKLPQPRRWVIGFGCAIAGVRSRRTLGSAAGADWAGLAGQLQSRNPERSRMHFCGRRGFRCDRAGSADSSFRSAVFSANIRKKATDPVTGSPLQCAGNGTAPGRGRGLRCACDRNHRQPRRTIVFLSLWHRACPPATTTGPHFWRSGK